MNTARAQAALWLHQPRCPRCGVDAAADATTAAMLSFTCPNCGEDWYARPPKSYAEREGIPTGAVPVRTGLPDALSAELNAEADWRRRPTRPHGWLFRVLAALVLLAAPRHRAAGAMRASSRTPGRTR